MYLFNPIFISEEFSACNELARRRGCIIISYCQFISCFFTDDSVMTLALAKANMEKILEYVQSQDANFVLLNAYSDKTDVDASALQAALQALKSLGISIPGLV